jgi:hypothetical protein
MLGRGFTVMGVTMFMLTVIIMCHLRTPAIIGSFSVDLCNNIT